MERWARVGQGSTQVSNSMSCTCSCVCCMQPEDLILPLAPLAHSACRAVWYCGTACSHADWRAGHRRVCKALGAARAAEKERRRQAAAEAAAEQGGAAAVEQGT